MSAVMAGTGHAADYHAPRTADGAPDLNGLWSNNSLTTLERPEDFKSLVASPAEAEAYEKKHLNAPPEGPPGDTVGGTDSEWWDTALGLARIRGQIRTSWLVSPADGALPFNAAAQAAGKARSARRKVDFDNPESRPLGERCLSLEAMGPPMMNGGYNDNYMFVQTRDSVAIMSEYMHDVRVVRMAPAQRLPSDVRVWMGDPIGHWEGETLVIESTNFTPAEVNSPKGDARADYKVTERLTRTGPDEILYSFIVDDPGSFDAPWQGELLFHATKGPIYEFACHEGNYGMENILAGGRQAEANKADAAKTKP